MNKLEILLNSKRNIRSVNIDNYVNIELSNKESLITEYDVRNAISASDIFDKEREENSIYRFYGKIDYLSLLNNLKLNYVELSSFFLKTEFNAKTLLNSFDIYLLKPSPSYTQIPNTTYYVRNFDVIARSNDFELFNSGFNTNLFNEQLFSYILSKDINIDDYLNNQFNIPITELFLFFTYKPTTNGMTPPIMETFSGTTWNNSMIEEKEVLGYKKYDIGDTIYGDLVNYSKNTFEETSVSGQTYYITTAYLDNKNETKFLQWKYNPFIPIRLRYLTNTLYSGNKNNSAFEVVNSIPDYATNIGNDNYVWRNIVPQGYLDPSNGNGVDYPFINKKRYVFSNLVLDVNPDLSHGNTNSVFNEILFDIGNDKILTNKPKNINNIGNPCL